MAALEEQARTTQRWRRIRAWFYLLVVVPLLALLGLVALAASPAGNRWLMVQAIEAADLFLPGATLRLGDLRTDVLRTVVIEKLELVADDGTPLIAVRSAELRWQPLALLRGELRVDSLVLREPWVTVTVDPDGRVDLLEALGLGGEDPEPDSGPWEGSPIDVHLSRLHIEDGRVVAVVAAAEGPPERWGLEDLDLALGFSLRGRELEVEQAVLATELVRGVGDAEPAGLPLGLSGSARLVDDPVNTTEQILRLDDLRLGLGSAVLGADGRIRGLGAAPELDLTLALRDLIPDELAPLVGELGLEGPFGLEAQATGPLEALAVQASLSCPHEAGNLRLGLGANLAAAEPTWSVNARLDDVEPHRFVRGIPEPFLLHGGLLAEGTGTRWPDGLDATVGLALEPGVIFGVGVDGVSVKAAARDGLVDLERLSFASALGRGSVAGRLDPGTMVLALDFGVSDVPLASLAPLGVEGLSGRGRASGHALVDLGGEAVTVTVDGQLGVRGGGYQDIVLAERLDGPLSLRWADGALGIEGTVEAAEVQSSGAVVGRVAGPWRFAMDPDGALSWQAQVGLGGVRYGVLGVEEARAAVEGGLPADGPLRVEVDVDARGLAAPSSVTPELRADRAVARLLLEGDDLAIEAQARDGEREVLRAVLTMDLATGQLELPALMVAPTPQTAWNAAEPVRATIVEGGVRDLMLQLRSGDALLWGLGDLDPAGAIDLRLMASDFTLDPLVPLFPGLPRGLAGTTRLALQVTGSTDAVALAGSVEIEGLVVPGSVRDLDARLVLDGDGRSLGFLLEVPEPPTEATRERDALPGLPGAATEEAEDSAPTWSSAAMLVASGRVPLGVSVEGVALDPDAPWSLDLLVAPGEVQRFGRRLELGELLEARLSAHAMVGGTPAASTLDVTAAAELPVGEDRQLVRLELDLHQQGEQGGLEVVVAQHMLRQAELVASFETPLATVVGQQAAALLGGPAPEGAPLDLAAIDSWVGSVDANLVPLGLSSAMLAQVVPVPEGLVGNLVGGLRLEGDPLHPAVSGALQLVDARLGEVGLAPALVTLAPAADGYDLGVTLGFADGGSLLVSGFAPLVIDLEDPTRSEASLGAPGLDLAVSGAGVPLAAVMALAGGAEEVEGLIRIEGGVEGSLLDPSAALTVALDEGRMTLPGLGVRYDAIRIAGGLEGKLVELDELHLKSQPAFGGGVRPGELELSGSAMLDGWVPDAVDLRGEADRFWAIDDPRNRLCFSGDFQAYGRWPSLDISGEVAVNDARFVLDESTFLYSGTLELDPRLQLHRGEAANAVRVEPPPPFWNDMVVNLALNLARATSVQVEMPFDDTLGALYASALTIAIDTRVDGLLDLTFSEGQLALLGEVEPVWGRADILGARFALGDGVISFVGGDPFDPILKLEAVHSTGRYGDVAVDITGSLADMGLSFRSDEYPDETDIVSILLMGAPMGELNSGGAGVGSALFHAALGAVMGEIENQGGGGHVVDMVELELDSGSNDLTAKAGRAFGDDIFVTVQHAAGAKVEEGENILEVTMDWTITRSWNAEFVTGDQGTSSADLYWTWRF